MDTVARIPARDRPPLPSVVDEVVQALREAFGERLRKVILFGSYARGEATADSDMDFLIVAQGKWGDSQSLAYHATTDLWFSHDCQPILSFLCMTPEHFEYLMRIRTSLARSLIREGIELWTTRATTRSTA
jgi:hypothetical protein